jgi:AcrR family transcriptional regulator
VARRTRRTILDAALGLFAERGYAAVSLRDVAERAGTTHGLLRHHFGAKDTLWRAVVAEADARYVAALPARWSPAADGDLHASLTHLVRSLLAASARHPEITRLLLHESTSGGDRLAHVLDHIRPLRRLTDPLLTRLHEAGRLTTYDEPAFFLLVLGAATLPVALSPLGQVVGGVGAGHPPGPTAIDHQADRVVDLLLGGTGRDAPGTAGPTGRGTGDPGGGAGR